MKSEIRKALAKIELDENVRVLLAVESGSRAWGFPSKDSDWDVRFIYLRAPEWYLSVQKRRDVLEFPLCDGLDVNGWDLQKALGLLAKSNPTLLEWLRSPTIYLERPSVAIPLRQAAARFFSQYACMHHYLHMGEGNYAEYLKGERVRVKKYFYALRPILACRWIAAHGTIPPMEFDRLVQDQLPVELRPIVDDLVARKRAGDELDSGPRIPEINRFLDSEIKKLNSGLPALGNPHAEDWEALDLLFRGAIHAVWEAGGPS